MINKLARKTLALPIGRLTELTRCLRLLLTWHSMVTPNSLRRLLNSRFRWIHLNSQSPLQLQLLTQMLQVSIPHIEMICSLATRKIRENKSLIEKILLRGACSARKDQLSWSSVSFQFQFLNGIFPFIYFVIALTYWI